MENAIKTQQTATYGDFRSPIRASFQNVPNALRTKKRDEKNESFFFIWLQQLATQLQESTYPVLLRSIIDGKNDRRYVHVQISSNMTDSKL